MGQREDQQHRGKGAGEGTAVDGQRTTAQHHLQVGGDPRFARRFAGRLETGAWGSSDPRIDAPAG